MTRATSIAQSGANNVTMRNRVINGAMMIDQRNAGASVTNTTSSTYTIDRWQIYGQIASKFSVQQNAGSVTTPSGFSKYAGITSLSALTPSNSDLYIFRTKIEGYNVADLGWGAAGALAITISFWVRSSLTGTFGAALQNNAGDRAYPFTYTINSANTWEQKTITIAGDTSGTWDKTNAIGIALVFGIGAGTDFTGPAGAWASAGYYSANGCTSVVATNAATWYITGVQLEAGTTATPFEQRLYGTELALCQRYCFVQSAESKNYAIFASMIGIAQSGGTQVGGPAQFPQQMRSAPSITASGSFRMSAYNTIFSSSSTPSFSSVRTTTTGTEWELLSLSGMTAGNAYYLQDQGSGTAKIVYSAEL